MLIYIPMVCFLEKADKCECVKSQSASNVYVCNVIYRGTHQFEMFTLTDRLTCSANGPDALLEHMLHIMKVTCSTCG